jgi:hypothetical protein
MSFIVGKGKQGKDAVADTSKYSKQLLKMKSGETTLVRMVSEEDYVTYKAHSAHKSFYTTPCTKPGGTPDLYDKACDLLYDDARKAEKEGVTGDALKAMKDRAYALTAKPRYLVAFISLETGEQILVDMTGNQGKVVTDAMEKYKTKKDRYAFELTKSGESTNTVFSLTPVLDMEEDISDKHRAMFEKTKDAKIDEEAFEKVFSPRSLEGQIEDLTKFGFDVSRLGIDANEAPAADAEPEALPDPTDDF